MSENTYKGYHTIMYVLFDREQHYDDESNAIAVTVATSVILDCRPGHRRRHQHHRRQRRRQQRQNLQRRGDIGATAFTSRGTVTTFHGGNRLDHALRIFPPIHDSVIRPILICSCGDPRVPRVAEYHGEVRRRLYANALCGGERLATAFAAAKYAAHVSSEAESDPRYRGGCPWTGCMVAWHEAWLRAMAELCVGRGAPVPRRSFYYPY